MTLGDDLMKRRRRWYLIGNALWLSSGHWWAERHLVPGGASIVQ
jgi:hypothetical protein